MTRKVKTPLLGFGLLILGIVFGLSPPGKYLEENFGLGFLFKLRGVRTPPTEVVIVAIDQASAEQLQLGPRPFRPDRWPRSIHAELLNKLADVGTKVIVFDIFFKEKRDQTHDEALAESMRASGNVVLFEHLTRKGNSAGSNLTLSDNQADGLQKTQPIDELKAAAAATAPFILPYVPVKAHRYWTFISVAENKQSLPVAENKQSLPVAENKQSLPVAKNKPSLPAAAFQIYALEAYRNLLARLRQAGIPTDELPNSGEILLASGEMAWVMRALRRTFKKHPDLADALMANPPVSAGASEAPQTPYFDQLIRMYTAPDSVYLNYYGPPRTISTVSYHRLIARKGDQWEVSDVSAFKDKAVFIGLSEQQIPYVKDADIHHTPFKQPNGVDLSGVEIAATAFANFLEDQPVRPLSPLARAGIMLLCGGLIVLICNFTSNTISGIGTAALCSIYLFISTRIFASYGIWLPVLTVLCGFAPVMFVSGVLIRYTAVNKERKAIRHAFTFYLPPQMVDRIAADKGKVTATGQLLDGAIMCSDLAEYASFSESIDPKSLNEHMHAYFNALFEPVKRTGGLISDLAGDSMMAFWEAKDSNITARYHACLSAVQIDHSLADFWKNSGQPVHLPTRIGIHYGKVNLGNVGALHHYEYKVTGDAVNTVARIENLNKHLRTHTLVSADALAEVEGFLTRKVGAFLLSGKSTPLTVYELIAHMENATNQQKDTVRLFADGLNAYLNRYWDTAIGVFDLILMKYPEDGPTLFYSRMCRELKETPPSPDWTGVVIAAKK